MCCLSLSTLTAQGQSNSSGLHGRATVASFGLSQESFGLHGRTTVASFGLSCTDAFRATVDGFGLDPLASGSIIYSFGLVWIAPGCIIYRFGLGTPSGVLKFYIPKGGVHHDAPGNQVTP